MTKDRRVVGSFTRAGALRSLAGQTVTPANRTPSNKDSEKMRLTAGSGEPPIRFIGKR